MITEDGVALTIGDRAYDYDSKKLGVIGSVQVYFADSVWFDFSHDDGTSTLLHGQRLYSVEFARKRGFKGA